MKCCAVLLSKAFNTRTHKSACNNGEKCNLAAVGAAFNRHFHFAALVVASKWKANPYLHHFSIIIVAFVVLVVVVVYLLLSAVLVFTSALMNLSD